jgi:hypothetical protein
MDEKSETPALDYFLNPPSVWDYGPNGECVTHGNHCPFASEQSHEEDQGGYVWNDPSEAHYTCSLLDNKTVWGEHPDCTNTDWATRAQVEIDSTFTRREKLMAMEIKGDEMDYFNWDFEIDTWAQMTDQDGNLTAYVPSVDQLRRIRAVIDQQKRKIQDLTAAFEAKPPVLILTTQELNDVKERFGV